MTTPFGKNLQPQSSPTRTPSPVPVPSSSGSSSWSEQSSDTALSVQAFHVNDDLNARPEAHHHDLGQGRNQASPGSHNHDGVTSVAILEGVTFTGSRSTQTANILNQICNALVQMGAVNSTVA